MLKFPRNSSLSVGNSPWNYHFYHSILPLGYENALQLMCGGELRVFYFTKMTALDGPRAMM